MNRSNNGHCVQKEVDKHNGKNIENDNFIPPWHLIKHLQIFKILKFIKGYFQCVGYCMGFEV